MIGLTPSGRIFSLADNQHFFRILDRQGGIIYDMFINTKKAGEFIKEKHRKGSSENKLLPEDFKADADILVFDNQVAMISFDNLVGIIIEDDAITNSQKELLKSLWNNI